MKTNRGEDDTTGAGGGIHAAGDPCPPDYLNRLTDRVGRFYTPHSRAGENGLPAEEKPLHLLLPPGIDGSALCTAIFAGLGLDCVIFASGGRSFAELEIGVQNNPGRCVLVLEPERLSEADLDVVLRLVGSTPAANLVLAGHLPLEQFWPNGAELACDVIGPREFCYREREFRFLIEASEAGAAPNAASHECHHNDLGHTDPFNLFELTQGWPRLSECAILEIYAAPVPRAGPSRAQDRLTFSLAQLVSVRAHFVDAWMPLIASRHRWLIEVSGLPLLNLDLLSMLYRDLGGSVRECMTLGWLEPCPKRSGFYQLNSAINVLLLSIYSDYENRDVLERAARWYRDHGYLSEAVECLVSFVDDEQLLAILRDSDKSKSAPGGSPCQPAPMNSLHSASSVARGSLQLPVGDSRARWAQEIMGNVAAIRAGAAQREGKVEAERTTASPKSTQDEAPSQPNAPAFMHDEFLGILDHVATAFAHHQDDNARAVSSALALAVEAGIDRQQLSVVIDFVDLHIRPLLRNEGSPLQLALRDLKHSAPARAVVAEQHKQLNHREMQILQRVCEGYKNREISEQLGLELSTIKWYVTGIYEKLQVRNRTQAVAKAQALGLFG